MKKDIKQNKALTSECTTIIVGEEQSADGSRFLARSSDFTAMTSINFEVHEATDFGPEEFVAKDSPFRCPLPQRALGYTAMPDTQFPGEWGSCGFNTAGVGMSSTETIFSSDKALAFDPYVADGLAENCTFNIVLPYIHTAREGVARLGSLIEHYGSAEGFGIGFIDENETWYLENCCGHRWLACRIPKDKYFVTGNQSRFRDYDPNDKDNFMASPGLIEFAKEQGLWDGKGRFDFHEAYQRDEKLDTTYNYPRVWGLQQMFTPSLKQDVTRNTFPVFARADRKLSLTDLRTAFRFHYDGTEHDPYLHQNGKEPYRPVSIFRTQQTHIMQYRRELPMAIGCVSYVAFGMADLSVFLPLYQGVKRYPKPYMTGSVGRADRQLSLADLRTAFRFHYDGTDHDPYLHQNGKEPYRPVSIFRTQQTHIMQYRRELPMAIGCISYVAFGMADLSVFLPLYQGVKSYPKPYMMGSVGRADTRSAYWRFRRVMTLAMTNYNAYAPIVKAAYARLEAENDQRQCEMEAEYLSIYKERPMEARDMLQRFSDRLLKRALDVADELEIELMSRLTADIETEYLFHGA